MKFYIIAGEASGDLHGSNLIRAIRESEPTTDIRFWGGDRMSKESGNIPVKHIRDLAFMGFVEVISNLGTILGNIKLCKKDILEFQPDGLILIDYPGFNLRIAKWAKEKGIRVYYYISPQIWAWKTKRIHKIMSSVDELYCIIPFEQSFYKQFNYDVQYVGHPLLEEVNRFNVKTTQNHSDNTIALLPGSRKQEIRRMLPVMLELVHCFPQFHFTIAMAPAIDKSFYLDIISEQKQQITLVDNGTYQLLSRARAAVVTSGTATLEAGLFQTPQIVVYKGNIISYWMAKRWIKVKYISLVNLILDRPLVTELIQHEFNVEQLEKELNLLIEKDNRKRILDGYSELNDLLDEGGASKLIAEDIIQKTMEIQ